MNIFRVLFLVLRNLFRRRRNLTLEEANTPPRSATAGRLFVGESRSGCRGLPKVVPMQDMNLVLFTNSVYNICQRTLIRFHTAGATSE